VDQDASVEVPISKIESAIQSAEICLAEITTDNPNVWFELGYALAQKKRVVLVCSSERTTPFPFDVRHRAIITYETHSQSDFLVLKRNITTKLNAFLKGNHAEKSVKIGTHLNIDGISSASVTVDEARLNVVAHLYSLIVETDSVLQDCLDDLKERKANKSLAKQAVSVSDELEEYATLETRLERNCEYDGIHTN
jgi:hypothetical protein